MPQGSEATFWGHLGSFDGLEVNPSHKTASMIGQYLQDRALLSCCTMMQNVVLYDHEIG